MPFALLLYSVLLGMIPDTATLLFSENKIRVRSKMDLACLSELFYEFRLFAIKNDIHNHRAEPINIKFLP